MANDERIFSCDDHLDMWTLPAKLWEERLPAGLRERGPRVKPTPQGDMWMVGDLVLGASRLKVKSYNALTRAGIDDDGSRASDPKLRLQDMDLDNIYASVIYGPSLFGLPIPDPELKWTCLATYNDWAADFNAVDRKRLCALPVLPTHTPEAAVKELERVAKLGHRGAIFSPFEARVADPQWEILWQACASLEMPLSFHIGGGFSMLRSAYQSWEMAAFSAAAPIQLDEPLCVMVLSGALERNPKMKLVLAEAGIGWMPFILMRMDASGAKHLPHATDYRLKQKPSEVFHAQVLATFEEEPLGPRLIPLIGEDNVMWASDYPHPDSTFPNSKKAIEEAFAGLDPTIRRKATAENCAQLYHLA